MEAQKLFMLVDDNRIDMTVNEKMVKLSKITDNTMPFLQSKEAMKYLEDHASEPDKIPDVILLDINMPNMNGFEFLEAFKNLPEQVTNKAKIFMLSSTLSEIDQKKAADDPHVVDILVKPLNPVLLKQAMA